MPSGASKRSDTSVPLNSVVLQMRACWSGQLRLSDISAYKAKWGHLLREGWLLIETTEEWTMKKMAKTPSEKIVKDIKRAKSNET